MNANNVDKTKDGNPNPADSTQKTIAAILTHILNVDEDQLTPEARLEDDLGADSIDMVEIAMQVEEEFGLVISDEQMEPVKTVGELRTAVEEALSERAAS